MRATDSPGTEAGRQASIVERARAGDRTAFDLIVTEYQAAIYGYVHQVIGNAEDAAHVTQDAFFKAYLILPKTTGDLRLGVWLYRIATHVCLDALRRRTRAGRHAWDTLASLFHPRARAGGNPEWDASLAASVEAVGPALARMRPQQRACLVLREFQGLSYEEIADVLTTTRAAVQSLLFRAREEHRRACAVVERYAAQAA